MLCLNLNEVSDMKRHYLKSNVFVNEVLGACQNAGLHVVATICDMDAKGVKALKLLAANRQKPFFKFRNQDILQCTI